MKPPDGRGGFVGLTLRRPVTVLMGLAAALAVAGFALVDMPIELVPEGILGGRTLHLSVAYPGASPREIEEEILKPIEEAIGSVPDVREIQAWAAENEGTVQVTFTAGADLDLGYAEVRDRMERIKHRLPAQADRYALRRRGGSSGDIPIVWLGLHFERDLREVSPLVDDIVRRKLERIDGVASVRIWGLAAEEVRIEVDPDAVRAHGVDLYALVQRLRGESGADTGGGHVFEGPRKYHVRSLTRLRSLEEARQFPVAPGLRLGDIAAVQKAYALQHYAFRALGKPAVGVAVFKESMANTATVADRIAAALEHDIRTDPRLGGIAFTIFWNQGTWIRASLNQLRDTAVWGALFALAILYVFLRRVRMTLLITAAIPISALIGLGALYFSGKTLNMLSLMGFTLAVGMLVDNSVVVVENIVRRRHEGEPPRTAAHRGARQVGLAIFMSTLTTLVVFLPFLFMAESGPSRNVLLEIVLPLVFSLVASLGVSLGLIPLATVVAVRRVGAAGARPAARLGRRLAAAYETSLGWVLRHRFPALLLGVLFLASSQLASARLARSGSDFAGHASYRIRLEFPRKFTLAEASAVVADYERFFVERLEALRLDFVFAHFTRRDGSLSAFLTNVPGWTPKALAARVEGELPVHAGVERHVRFEGQDEEADARTTIPIHIYGPDSRVLGELAVDLKPRLEAVPGVVEVTTQEEAGREEIHLRVDRTRAGKYEVDPRAVLGSVVYALQGARLADFVEDEREIPMVMRFRAEDTEGLEAFETFRVFSRTGEEIPLEALSSYAFRSGAERIARRNRRTMYELLVRVADPERLWATSLIVQDACRSLPLPPGYTWEPAGSVAAIQDETRAMIEQVGYAVLFVFLLMGILFESLALPASVLVTIPTAIVGGLWALVATGTHLDVIGMMGFVILVGIVVNNGIVMVDFIHRLRREGDPPLAPVLALRGQRLRPIALRALAPEAALAALRQGGLTRPDAVRLGAHHRLRPVLMTALTTIAGLLPIALSAPAREGFDYLPLSRIVVGGLVTATVFSLYLVPVAYTLLDDLQTWARGVAGELRSRGGTEGGRV
ncbi:MAG: efflux RND transporter permease subunit [Planctomycetes bacterium]|nr:efflux RND transporter permease subunit [Planctomycetota bacterium]